MPKDSKALSLCYATFSPDGKKRSGGSMTATDYNDAAEQLAARHDVWLSPTGSARFISRLSERDKREGRTSEPLCLYLSIVPENTAAGRAMLAPLKAARQAERDAADKAAQAKAARLQELLDGMTDEEAISRLSQPTT